MGTKFQFAAERLLGRGRRGPGQLGLRGTLRGTGLGVGGGRTGLGTGRQMFHQDSKATSHPLWKRHRARLLSSCPTRVDTEGRGPLHPHPPERAPSDAAGGGEKGFKRKKNTDKKPEAAVRDGGGKALWTPAPAPPRTDPRAARGGGGDVGRGEVGGHRACPLHASLRVPQAESALRHPQPLRPRGPRVDLDYGPCELLSVPADLLKSRHRLQHPRAHAHTHTLTKSRAVMSTVR